MIGAVKVESADKAVRQNGQRRGLLMTEYE
jgi:hypothetical protein